MRALPTALLFLMAGVAFVGGGLNFPYGEHPELWGWTLGAELCLFVAWLGLTWWFAKRAYRRLEDFRVLLVQGRTKQALELLERVGDEFPHASGVALYRGYTLMLLWRLDEADEALTSSAGLEEYARRPRYSRARAPFRALAKALLGQVQSANDRLAEAEHHGVADDPHALLARLVLCVRSQSWSDASRLAMRSELSQLGGVLRGLADALVEWTNRAQDHAPAPFKASDLLGEADVAAVRKVWPELAAFLESNPEPTSGAAA